MTAGDILDYAYTGAAQTVVLPPGRYRLECWGAQGGYRSNAAYGGKGGYSVGELTLSEETTLYVQVGGSGNTGKTSGGYNGGGKRSTYNGGGGGTDIRIGKDDLYARVIVAGGGGSDGASSKAGMYGGGESGGTNTASYGTGGGGGTQTAGGAGGSSNSGTFGVGGEGLSRSSGYGGAGGGGWYGGGGAYPDSSGDDDRGGGGGSGFTWTGANAPTGYLLGSEYYLANASTTAGNVSFTGPTGTAETGHSGDGYARITVLEVFPQGPEVPANFRQTAKDYFSLGLAWDAAADAAGYRLYRDGTLLATLTATSYTDSAVEPGESYRYSLIAYNADGDSDPATLTASTLAGFAFRTITFSDAAFSANPCDINGKTVLSLSAAETVLILEPEHYYSGDLYSGEV
nr:MAG TPA: Glycine rich protein [Caudoviricetes sp.]